MTRFLPFCLCLTVALSAPSASAGWCARWLQFKDEVVATHGRRIFLREAKPTETSWLNGKLQKMGAKLMPTILTTTLLISIPSTAALYSYLDWEEERAMQALDELILYDERFAVVRNAQNLGLDPDRSRSTALLIKQYWEEYARDLLRGPMTPDLLERHIRQAEEGIVPYERLKLQGMTPEAKALTVELVDQYNLKLILLSEYLYNPNTKFSKHTQVALNSLVNDKFVSALLHLSQEDSKKKLVVLRVLQVDIENQLNLAIAKTLGVQIINPVSEQQMTLQDLREELLKENHLKI